ncbi:tripartite-type tricarboxylate transporter receptor subunit TctC [Variovorax beijingensis]|uniref:Tripartite-type tricarboxylate transporter receptor subunit TctC n=2 Tax=Variovorax TaxID=34072 RepID=A0AAE3Y366_VARPD|nr:MULTISPECIES: tripartite tricarboxylate transporter substrate binding protein [Variovorax]MDP9968710.1 tripartite-type tricarboxylate transporter receptor subunit TctC [Variovorax paradoxus]MDR6430243.1 tripartite-type tricarboxylate transporter receptor subunit TctC [Variovorax paradoxus]MDR6456869.1 tripartite-type tricarboxylate transporter receptor subunit TctC [Variovorax paradoxus]TWD72981.1 tripartite-type tricarboxylate transporter receptor subunit TctC [Variovorax beijingensis]
MSMLHRRTLLLAGGAGLVAAAVHTSARAQGAWPEKPIRLVLPFSAGGPGDITARLLAQGLGKQLNQSVIVDNKPGAGGIIGCDFVAKSAPDGYTLLIAGNGAVANALLRTKMPYADSDLLPVVEGNTAPSVLVAAATAGFRDLKELQAYGKRKGAIFFGTAGAGSTGHFVAEMLGAALGVPVTIVHYKSGSETVNAIIGGQIDLASEAPIGVMGYVKGGKLRAVAVTAAQRTAVLPEVPTTTEQGFPTIQMQHWGGLFVPRGTPPEVMDRIAQAVDLAFKTDDAMRAQFAANGSQVGGGTRAEFAQRVAREKQRLGKIVADARMSLD